MRWLATAVLLLLLAATLGGGLFLLFRSSSPPAIEFALPDAEVKVYVSGAVARPGVYALQPGARLEDAVKAAGGLADDADSSRINLALRVRDEDHFHILRTGEPLAAPASSGGASGGDPRLDLNSATAADLEALPGIGTVKAQAIIAYRQQHGPFQRVEDLLAVPGFGPTMLDQIRSLVTAR